MVCTGEHFSALGDKEGKSPASHQMQAPSPQPSGPKITEVTGQDDARVPPTPSSPQSAPPIDPHVQQILADPANREILMDPKVQQLIQHLRSDPQKAQK